MSMLADPNSKDFRTSDTPLAAYLISEGFEPLDIDYSNPKRADIIFPNDSSSMITFIREYQLSKAVGNITSFYNAHRYLIHLIHARLPWVAKNRKNKLPQ